MVSFNCKKLRTLTKYPCQWDDLLDENDHTYLTVYTLKDAQKDDPNAKIGITKAQDGIYDIVIDAPELTKDLVRQSLEDLTKITGIKYNF